MPDDNTILTAQNNTDAGMSGGQQTTPQPGAQPTTQPPNLQPGQQQQQIQQQPKQGPPEKYEAFKIPDGLEYDQEMGQQFTAVAKELGLSQAQAQRLVDLYSGRLQTQLQSLQKQIDAWAEETKQDPVIGGADYQQKIGVAVKALNQFGTPELKHLLNVTGLGNHKEVIKFFYNVGKAISEDKFVEGNNINQTKSIAEVLYPNQGKG